MRFSSNGVILNMLTRDDEPYNSQMHLKADATLMMFQSLFLLKAINTPYINLARRCVFVFRSKK